MKVQLRRARYALPQGEIFQVTVGTNPTPGHAIELMDKSGGASHHEREAGHATV